MAFEQEKREALYLLDGLENGTMTTSTASRLIDEADPALVYFLLTWLRDRYGRDHPAAAGVIGRLVELTNGHSTVKSKMREGKADGIVKWFEETHEYRAFTGPEFVALIVEKLEG